MRVKLQDVVKAIDSGRTGAEYYYETKIGGIVRVSEKAVNGDANPALLERSREEQVIDYIPVPRQYDIDEYFMIEEFIYELQEGREQDILERAVRGKDASDKFMEKLYDLGLEERWRRYREDACKKVAREWCGRYKIEIEE